MIKSRVAVNVSQLEQAEMHALILIMAPYELLSEQPAYLPRVRISVQDDPCTGQT